MTNLLGYPLDRAVALAMAEGYRVSTKELTCKKGPAGTDNRVIRVLSVGENALELTYSAFTTETDCGREG